MEDLPDLRAAGSSRHSSRVCARCKKRKIKCDSGYPSCSACTKARAICRGSGPADREDLPRSLVRALEDQVAQLERQVAELQRSPASVALAWTSKLTFSTLSAGATPSRPFFLSSVSPFFFIHPSCPPLLVSRITTQIHSAAKLSQPQGVDHNGRTTPPLSPPVDLTKIPRAALDQMIWNYTNIHLPQYPCIQESWLHEIATRLLKIAGNDADIMTDRGTLSAESLFHFEFFVLFIILAISSLTLTWKNEFQARSASDSFFSSSVHHLRLITGITEIQNLQASLLLAHYAHMNPGKIDNWACIWNASRIMIQLGLHKSATESICQEHAQLRNQLFWVTYGMERSLCSTLILPLSFTEESITASRPFNLPDDDYAAGHQASRHLYRYRALETEVHRVLYLQDDLVQGGSDDIKSWLSDVAARLDEWLKGAHEFSKYQMLEFQQVQYSYLKARIFRPTPRFETRSPEERQICFDVCSALVDDYQRQTKRRRLFYPWHAVHILFEAALIMLEACWALRDHETMRHKTRHILSVTVPDCLILLAKVAESWPDALLCSEYLGSVVDEITRAYRYRTLSEVDMTRQETERATTERLRQLLFPQGALSWSSPVYRGLGNNVDIDGAQLPGDIPFPGLDEFDWNTHWDFLQHLPSMQLDSHP
ncbi:hypothetical protein BX600DRAFT_61505 [Xylariales sp. PMI_506]|nr:hypothetical protein BX600DRAFT_61505 [Xylariales sp. PMI_506]